MDGGFIYLASPYSHPEEEIRIMRYMEVCKMADKLMKEGYNVFCPIAHSCAIEHHGAGGMMKDGKFWKKQDMAVLRHASKVVVLQLPGWDISEGIKWETETAKICNIPVEYIQP